MYKRLDRVPQLSPVELITTHKVQILKQLITCLQRNKRSQLWHIWILIQVTWLLQQLPRVKTLQMLEQLQLLQRMHTYQVELRQVIIPHIIHQLQLTRMLLLVLDIFMCQHSIHHFYYDFANAQRQCC